MDSSCGSHAVASLKGSESSFCELRRFSATPPIYSKSYSDSTVVIQGPHLLAPTGSDLSRYGKGTVFAGYHYDLNVMTIHGKSRFPGLFIWLRDGTRVPVKVPDGCLLLQVGKQVLAPPQGFLHCIDAAPSSELLFKLFVLSFPLFFSPLYTCWIVVFACSSVFGRPFMCVRVPPQS